MNRFVIKRQVKNDVTVLSLISSTFCLFQFIFHEHCIFCVYGDSSKIFEPKGIEYFETEKNQVSAKKAQSELLNSEELNFFDKNAFQKSLSFFFAFVEDDLF